VTAEEGEGRLKRMRRGIAAYFRSDPVTKGKIPAISFLIPC
jgi:hypothetical protein